MKSIQQTVTRTVTGFKLLGAALAAAVVAVVVGRW